MGRATILVPLAIVIVALGLASVFTVNEKEKALVLQFGQIVRVEEQPGLQFKLPFLQQVVKYDDRILGFDIDPIEVTPSDDRRLIVDAFVRYKVKDVVRFRQATGAGGVGFAEGRIRSILPPMTREVLGNVTSADILSKRRSELATAIRDRARKEAAALGVDIVDVRLKRSDLPVQNLDATFARMRAEREREAADEIARGNEAAQRVRASADRARIELVSDAKRKAEIARGEADATRNRIFAEAYGSDAEFFEFYRSLAAYRASLLAGNSTIVMAPDSEFFRYLETSQKPAPALAPAAPASP
jgi:membrane protease subunit HflC